MKKLKIGFAAGFMDGFSPVGLDMFADYQKKLDRMSGDLNFEIIHFTKPMLTVQEARRIRNELDAQQVDFLLLFIPAYIIGDQVYEVMKATADVGLWAIEEPRDEGPMPLASFVNLSQNASIARNYFKGGGKKVKWFFGPLDGPLFKPRFEITVRVLAAKKNLRDARVAQIGKLADGHINHYNDVRDIYRCVGVDVSRDYEVEDIIAMVSLYRPGPMDNIPTYINRKHGEEPVDCFHPMLEKILGEKSQEEQETSDSESDTLQAALYAPGIHFFA